MLFWILYGIGLIVSGIWFRLEMVGWGAPADWTPSDVRSLEVLISAIPGLNLIASLIVIVEALFPGESDWE